MAKQLTITDPTSGVTYTLEYTRKTVEIMERQGFVADDVQGTHRQTKRATYSQAFFLHL